MYLETKKILKWAKIFRMKGGFDAKKKLTQKNKKSNGTSLYNIAF